jgi:uncharacterized membrane protein YdjX (TVP38/TMEM64 family)
MTKASSGRRILLLLGAAAALVLLLVAGRTLAHWLVAFAEWVQRLGAWGPAVFILGYVVACIAFVPGTILTLAAGALFGVWKGTAYVFAGAVLGSVAAFLVARHAARGAIEKRVEGNRRFAAVDEAIGRQGLRIVLLLRLSPVFPFNLLNYALGLTKVSFRDYLVGSIGMIPGTLLYVWYGAAIGSLARIAAGERPQSQAGTAFLVAGLVATIVATIFITRAAQRALRQATEHHA